MEPIPPELKAIKDENDKQLKDIFTGKDNRFVVIVGPCSADDEEAVCDYMRRLNEVKKQKEEAGEKVTVSVEAEATTEEAKTEKAEQPAEAE